MRGPASPNHMFIRENFSALFRFNDEKSSLEYLLTRALPAATITKATSVHGVTTGVHSDWTYKQLEAAVEGVLDLKVEEIEGEIRNMIRVRKMLNAPFDSRWHPLKVGKNFEVTLEK